MDRRLPDAEKFYSPLYCRNVRLSNDARLRLPEYDKAHAAMRALPEEPERAALYGRMNDLFAGYVPWILDTYRYQNLVAQPGLRGLKLHPFMRDRYMCYEVVR